MEKDPRSDQEAFADRVRRYGRETRNTLLDIKDAAPTIAKEIGKTFVGESPSEWAFNLGLMPIGGPLTKSVALGAAALLRDQEAKGVLTSTAKGVPARLEKMYEYALNLVKQGKGHKVHDLTRGNFTVSPSGAIEGAYRPLDVAVKRIGTERIPTKLEQVAEFKELFSDHPLIGKIKTSAKDMGTQGGLFRPSGTDMPGHAMVNKEYIFNNPAEARRVLGHEAGGHGAAQLTGGPKGGNPSQMGIELDVYAEHLRGMLPHLKGSKQAEAARLLQFIEKPGQNMNLYRRLEGEIGAEAASSLWKPGMMMDPYKSSTATRHLQIPEGATIRMEKTPAARIFTPTSPIKSGDLMDYLSTLTP